MSKQQWNKCYIMRLDQVLYIAQIIDVILDPIYLIQTEVPCDHLALKGSKSFSFFHIVA
jgi:hypothetical protein